MGSGRHTLPFHHGCDMSSGRFIGEYPHNIDDKGRVAIPHRFRTLLGGDNQDRVVITRSPRSTFRYLDIYPADEWDTTVDRILSAQIGGDNPVQMREIVLANYVHTAKEVDLDKQGRILIPQDQREFAALDREVIYTGDVRRFRLWSKAEHDRYLATTRTPDALEELEKLGVVLP